MIWPLSPVPGKSTLSSQPHRPPRYFCSPCFGRLGVCTYCSLYLELGRFTSILPVLTSCKPWLKWCHLRGLFSDYPISFCFLNFLPSFIFLHSTCCLLKPYAFYISILFIVCLLWKFKLCQSFLFCSLTSCEILGKLCNLYASVSSSIKCR